MQYEAVCFDILLFGVPSHSVPCRFLGIAGKSEIANICFGHKSAPLNYPQQIKTPTLISPHQRNKIHQRKKAVPATINPSKDYRPITRQFELQPITALR